MGRKHRPRWQVHVDYWLFQYVDDPTTIRIQEGRIRELRLTGTRTTAAYILREGSSGGESITKEERYVQEIEQAEEQIRISQERIAIVNKVLCDHFSAEEQEFIRLFWLDVKPVDRGLIWLRNKQVIQEIRWFIDPEKRDRPSRDYYSWRTRIYNKWYNLLWPDREKDDGLGDYVESIVLDTKSKFLNAQELKG